ncbi:MAG: hypothetical protein JKY65_03485 [Planctomycetes bacterium]|nr:hypothetical protein [Planctomycetota bacterium]
MGAPAQPAKPLALREPVRLELSGEIVNGIELLGSGELSVPGEWNDQEEIKLALSVEDLPIGMLEQLKSGEYDEEEDPFDPASLDELTSELTGSKVSSRRQAKRTSNRRTGQEQTAAQGSRGQARGTSSRRQGKTVGQGSSRRSARTSSRRQRAKDGERLPSGRVAPRRQPPWLLLGVVGSVAIVGVLVGLVVRKRNKDLAQATPTPTASSTATPKRSSTPKVDPLKKARLAYFARQVGDLEADLTLLEKDRPEDRGFELERLRSVLDRLRLSPSAKSAGIRLRASASRLSKMRSEAKSLVAPGGKRAREAWDRVGRQFQGSLRQALTFRHGGWQSEIERQLEGPTFRTSLRRQVGIAGRSGSKALCELSTDPRWAGILGERLYKQMIRSGDLLLPQAVRNGRDWQGIRSKLVARQRESVAYFAAHRTVLLAAAKHDLAAAERALRGHEGVWIEALAKLLKQPRYVAFFENKPSTGPTGGGGGSDGGGSDGGGGTTTGGGPAVDLLAGDWRIRFRAGAKRHLKARKADKPKQGEALAGVLAEAVAQAKESHEICCEAIDLLDEYARLLAQEPALHAGRDTLHTLYFDEEFRLASGPMTFHALDAWCQAHKRDSWRTQLAPWLKKLRLVGQDGKSREKERRARAEGIAAAGRFERSRRSRMASKLESLIRWMRVKKHAPETARQAILALIRSAVSRGNPFAGARLEALVQALPKSGSNEKLAKLFKRKRLALIEDLRKRTFKAITGAIRAGEPGRGFDFFQYLLRVDPENKKAHQKLGHIRVQGRWLRRFEAEQLKGGLRWDSKLAWVRTKHEDKYRQGQVYDFSEKRWRSLSEANQTHAKPPTPWVLKTEHFELRSTADLARSVWIADRLEAFYLVLFRHYDLFFAHKGGAGLVFGVSAAQRKPFVVNFYRSRQQYVQYSDPVPGSAGFYSPAKHASFFYDSGPNVTTLQHEITHQILGETLRGGRTSAWLAEGSAVYLEGVAESEGQLRLGGLLDNQDLASYVRLLPGGKEHTFSSITEFHDQGAWGQNLDIRNYRGAGAAVYFLIHMDGGRYRGDYLRMLKEGYLGQRSEPVRYTNLSAAVLEELMKRFYEARSVN